MSVPSRTARRLRGVIPAAAAALLLAGCGADGLLGSVRDDSAPGGSEPTASPSTGSPSTPGPTPPASPSAGAPTGTPGSGLPEADDGTDLTACSDGSCEVRVRAGDSVYFQGDLGLDTYTVDTVAHGALWHRAVDGESRLAGSLSAPGTARLNGLVVEILAVEDDQAVIRLTN